MKDIVNAMKEIIRAFKSTQKTHIITPKDRHHQAKRQTPSRLVLQYAVIPVILWAASLDAFRLWQEEMKQAGQYSIAVDGTVKRWKSEKPGRKVEFNSSEVDVRCPCQMFESTGVLCRHAIRILIQNSVMELPERYFLKRWRRYHDNGIDKLDYIRRRTSPEGDEQQDWQYRLALKAKFLAEEAAK